MKALSIMQPWAWLIVNGFKDIENRDWRRDHPDIGYRGEFLIHTGLKDDKNFDWLEYGALCNQVIPRIEDLPRGGIVGIAEIVDCVKDHPSPWFCGRYGFVLRNARPLEFRPCVGRLGFFNPDYSLTYAVKPPKKEKPPKTEKPERPALPETIPLF